MRISLGDGRRKHRDGSGARPEHRDGRPAALTVSGLSAGYNDTPTIIDVDLHVGAGEIVTVLGPNGAGKSTLLKAVLGHLRPMSGTVRLGDTDLAGLRSDQVCRLSVGYVPQVNDTSFGVRRFSDWASAAVGGHSSPVGWDVAVVVVAFVAAILLRRRLRPQLRRHQARTRLRRQ